MKVGLICSRSGPLRERSAAFLAGLERGLEEASLGGRVELDVVDDGGEAGKAVAAAGELVATGATVLLASTFSAVAAELAGLAQRERILFVAGTATADALTGINRYTFRSGRQLRQDVLALAALLEGESRHVLTLTRATAVGEELASAATAVLGGRGHRVETMRVPPDTAGPGDLANRVRAAAPDVVFVGWDAADLATVVADVATLPVVASLPTAADLAGLAASEATFVTPAEPSAAEGIVAARILTRALAAAGDGVDAMIAALEGWSFDGTRARHTIRASDHALLQPMLAVKMARGEPSVPTVVAEYTVADLERLEPSPGPQAGATLQHVGIMVHDLERAIRFYVDALGGSLLVAPVPFQPPDAHAVFGGLPEVAFRFALVGFGSTGIEIFQFADPAVVPETAALARGLPHFALQVHDTAGALLRVEAAGGARFWPAMGGFGRARTWYVSDPDGNLFELIDRTVWAVAGAAHDLHPAENPAPTAESPYV